jgi:uncharacterized protein (TIGR02996 family)
MAENRALLKAVREAPDNEIARLVYADWLEERGDPRGPYLRLDTDVSKMRRREKGCRSALERLIELRKSFRADWIVDVSQGPHDVIKQMDIAEYPKSLRGSGTSRTVEAPSWIQVERAIRKLNRHSFPFLWLFLEERDPDAERFDVMGGNGAWVMWGTIAGDYRHYQNPRGGKGTVDVWTSDQGSTSPAKYVCDDLATVIRAAKYVYYCGTFTPELTWA